MKMLAQFSLIISHSQIFVNRPDSVSAGLLWTDQHTAQGFAWAPDIVCFGVPDTDKQCFVEVDAKPTMAVSPLALWALHVPFVVPTPPVIVGSTFEDREVAVPPGQYDLLFQALPAEAEHQKDWSFVLRLDFCANPFPDFKILKQGAYLRTPTVLRRDADYA